MRQLPTVSVRTRSASSAPRRNRWLIWFKCRECQEELYMHDPHYKRKHGRVCPVGMRLFPSRHGYDKGYREHQWRQQELVEHDCDCNTEAPV